MTEKSTIRLPFYAKAPLILVFLFFLFYVIYLGQAILLPLGFAFLFAVLLRPVERLLVGWHIPRVISIVICLLLFAFVIFLLITFVSHQVTVLADDIPRIKKSLGDLWEKCQLWLNDKLNISYKKQDEMVSDAKNETINTMAPATFNLLTSSFVTLTLLPVYIFLLLYYRTLFLQFLVEVFESKHESRVKEVINEVRSVIQHFVTGIMLETTLVAILNVAGLFLVGAPYAILLGVTGAIINTIPYIGGIVQLVLSGLIVFSYESSVSAMFWSVGILIAVQFIDNYLLIPRIVASRVKLNGLISIVGFLVAGAIAGIGGMFLSIPFLAISKIVFDRVDGLKPWGKLMGGEEQPSILKASRKRKAPQK